MKQYVVVGYRAKTVIIIDESDDYYALYSKNPRRDYPRGALIGEDEMKRAVKIGKSTGGKKR